jgi:hypothetical protein
MVGLVFLSPSPFSFPIQQSKKMIRNYKGHGLVRYSVYNGDPNGYFTVDPVSGMISTKSRLDHETQPFVLLNIQAASGTPPSYGHTQVRRKKSHGPGTSFRVLDFMKLIRIIKIVAMASTVVVYLEVSSALSTVHGLK